MKQPILFPQIFLVLIFQLLLTAAAIGQEKIFLNVNQEVTEEKFAYFIQTNEKDSGNYHCLKTTYTNGAIFFTGCISSSVYESAKNRKYVGLCKWYYKNGNLKQVATYNANGEIDGTASSYHENGKLKSKVEYKNGIRVTKKMVFFEEDGNQYTLFKDDFKNNSNEWEVYRSELNEAYIEGEKFVLNSLSEQGTSRYINYPIKTPAYEIELDIAALDKKGNAPIRGVIYNYSNWDNYTYFIVQGVYFSIGRYVDGSHQKSADLLSTIRLDPKGKNVLKIKNEYDQCSYYINGHLVHKTDPQTLKYDKIGMIVGGQGIARFNYLSVKETAANGIAIDVEDKDVKSSGSGFLITNDGYIITNHHVVDGASRVYVEFPATEKSFLTRVVLKDKASDLALLKIEDSSFVTSKHVPYTLSTSVLDVGSSVFTLGYPFVYSGLGKEIKFADGKISSKTGFDNDIYIYQTTIPIQPGNSGSPMFDEKGNVVGCMNAVYRDADNISYSIKSNFIRTLIQSSSEQIDLPTEQKLSQLELTDKIKELSHFVCIVKIL